MYSRGHTHTHTHTHMLKQTFQLLAVLDNRAGEESLEPIINVLLGLTELSKVRRKYIGQ